METLLITAATISVFLLGVSTGAILENRLTRNRVERDVEEIKEVGRETIKEISISLADQINSIVRNSTLVDYQTSDPDQTLEIPVYEEELWQRKQRNLED